MSAMLKIETPESCADCPLWRYCLNDKGFTIFDDRRNPDCPLKIVSGNGCALCNKEGGVQTTFARKLVCLTCWENLAALHIERYGFRTKEHNLRPCPYCGGKAEIIIEDEYQNDFSVQCKGCYARIGWSARKDKAIAAWNRREG